LNSDLYLLDTNTVSYSVKGTYPGVRARLSEKSAEQLAISAITEAELRFWIANRPQETRVRIVVDNFLGRISSMPWDSAVTETYAQLKANSRRTGRALAELDLLIAAHAIALDAILVTHDQAFSQILGLRTEDWV
jgi:tRNA(fMet)-specific endonuclease VapC